MPPGPEKRPVATAGMRLGRILCALLCLSLPRVHGEVGPAPEAVALTTEDRAMAAWIAGRQEAMVEDLRTVVEINSGTLNRQGIDRVRTFFADALADLGFAIRLVPGGEVPEVGCRGGVLRFADHLLAERHAGIGTRLLLNGHLDTVFPADSDFQHLTVADDVLRGPGVLDMKGGLIVMLYALRALEQQGILGGLHVTVLLNSDEEMGSLGSRPTIEEQARQHDLGLVFEGSVSNELVRSRKGLGQARIRVEGRAAHAGSAHEEGLSAIRELAHKIVEIEQLTDYDREITVNVGLVAGGDARNVVPACAEAAIDVRFPDNEAGAQTLAAIRRIAATPYTRNSHLQLAPASEIWATLHRPAKPAVPGSDALLATALGISAQLGEPLGTEFSGGGTDGSLMQAVGLPNVDSLGVDGTGNHSPREEARLRSLVIRTQLVAILLRRIGNAQGR